MQFAKDTHSERTRELEVANAAQKVLVHDLKVAKEELGDPEERKALLNEINEKMTESKSEMSALLHKRNNISSELDEQIRPHINLLQNKIKSAQSINDRKLELLRSKFEHAYRGTLWLRKNHHLFKGKVYEPMLLEVRVFVVVLLIKFNVFNVLPAQRNGQQ